MSDFDDYQRWTRTTAVYAPEPQKSQYGYLGLGLTGEAGEVAEHLKKFMRDGVLADELGFNLSEVARRNQDKLTSRRERGVIKGSGDDR